MALHLDWRWALRACLLSIFATALISAAASHASYQLEDVNHCVGMSDCTKDVACMNCSFPADCQLGDEVIVNCSALRECSTRESIRLEGRCRYCWQTEPWEHECELFKTTNCSSTSTRLQKTTCRVHPHVVCLGRRTFYKGFWNVRCNWSSGYSWARSLLLSATLGGFGADRFYLGLWKSAIGKLFSFGGLGIWTIVDVVLIATGYIRPADGSLYV